MTQKPAIYQAEDGAIELNVDARHETIWATQAQIAKLFGIDRTGATRHINNILKDGEVSEKSNVQKMHIANADRPTTFYSLDIILGVGYRANSAHAIAFRKWATATLRSYIREGYVIDRDRIQFNLDSFLKAVEDIKLLGAGNELVNKTDVLELVKTFAGTWFSLDAYDKAILPESGATRESVKFTAEDLAAAIGELKSSLVEKGEATELFAQPRQAEGLEAVIGNIFQTFGGQDVYPTVEEKAAHLLYLVVKNHIFTDGNKRSGAFAFVWFLQKTGLLRPDKMTPTALTALTLLVAESDPKQKDRMVGLILLLLSGMH